MTDRADAGLGATIPALPVRDVPAAVEHYRTRFGFEPAHLTDDFAVLVRDGARIHLWAAGDDGWRSRADFDTNPVCSGAESFIAGTASCRMKASSVAAVDALFLELQAMGVLHGVSQAGATDTDFGTHEFSCLDIEGNAVEFFVRVDR